MRTVARRIAVAGLLLALGTTVPAQTPAPTLTADQQKDLRIVEQEAEKALLTMQLAEARFVLARDAMVKHLATLHQPGYRLEKLEAGWRFVPVEGQ